jgi:homoaconitase
LIGATNDQNEKVNSAVDYVKGEPEGTIPEMAKRWKARGQPWMIVTDVSSWFILVSYSCSECSLLDSM